MGFNLDLSPFSIILDAAKMTLGSAVTSEMGGMLSVNYFNIAISGILASILSIVVGCCVIIISSAFFLFLLDMKQKASLAYQISINQPLCEWVFKVSELMIMSSAIAITSVLMGLPFWPLLGSWGVGCIIFQSSIYISNCIYNIFNPQIENSCSHGFTHHI